jgi:hypothetical protein
VHKSPTFIPIVSQINQVHSLSLYIFKIHFNIVLVCISRPPACSYSSAFPTKTLHALLISSIHHTEQDGTSVTLQIRIRKALGWNYEQEIATLTENLRDFPHSLKVYARTVPRFGQDLFLPSPFQIFIYYLQYYCMYSFRYWQCHKILWRVYPLLGNDSVITFPHNNRISIPMKRICKHASLTTKVVFYVESEQSGYKEVFGNIEQNSGTVGSEGLSFEAPASGVWAWEQRCWTESSFETPACQDMSLGAEELNWVECRDASLPGHELGSRGVEFSWVFGIGNCKIRMWKEDFMCDLKWQWGLKIRCQDTTSEDWES